MEKRKFVILSSPRSGSTIFRLWLNSHKTIRCHDEVLLKMLDAKDSIHSYALETIGTEELSGKYVRDTLGQPNDEFFLQPFWAEIGYRNVKHHYPLHISAPGVFYRQAPPHRPVRDLSMDCR